METQDLVTLYNKIWWTTVYPFFLYVQLINNHKAKPLSFKKQSLKASQYLTEQNPNMFLFFKHLQQSNFNIFIHLNRVYKPNTSFIENTEY